MSEQLDTLIEKYAQSLEAEANACADLDQMIMENARELEDMKAERALKAAPFQKDRDIIQAEVKPLIIAEGKTYKGQYGKVSFRKGATRITYDAKTVDVVLAMLKDTMPNLWQQLAGARKETTGEPSFSIEVSDD